MTAADGWIAVTLARPTDRELLPAWLGIDPGAASVVSNADPWADVARRVGGREIAELVESGTALGLACAGVGELSPRPAVLHLRLGDAPPRQLRGLRVVNLGALWAGPLAAHVLTRLGADVVCVESTGRPDGARATPHWFDAMHVGQRSVALDFRRDEGLAALAALLAAADVVIEGSRPRALRATRDLGVRLGEPRSARLAVDHRLRARSGDGDAGRARRRCRRRRWARRLGRRRSRLPRRCGRRPADRVRRRPRDRRRCRRTAVAG